MKNIEEMIRSWEKASKAVRYVRRRLPEAHDPHFELLILHRCDEMQERLDEMEASIRRKITRRQQRNYYALIAQRVLRELEEDEEHERKVLAAEDIRG